MAAPFGPSPKLGEYLEWVRGEGGCGVQHGVFGTTRMVRITASDGRHATILGLQDDETVSHSLIANLDRRLGVDAPFPKTPQPYR